MIKRLTISTVFLTGLLTTACTKFLQIPPPQTQLVTASVFNNNEAATSALTNIYSQMMTNTESSTMAINLGLLSDELTNYYNSNATYVQYYTNSMAATMNSGYGIPWNNAYNYIYQANAIIAAVTNNTALSQGVQQQLLGEAKFIRAFWFFYLTNLYGDIPLVTSTDYSINSTIARTPSADVYKQIVADLKDAKTLLNRNYIDASDTTVTSSDRTRPNKSAAAALLARAYLYSGDNIDAEAESDSIISNILYNMPADLNSVFLPNSNEAIWQLGIPLPSSINTPDATEFILLAPPGPNANCCSISPQLLNSFEPGDARRANWVDSFQTTTTPIMTYYYPYKYKVYDTTVVVEEVMVFRLAEQYLIRAEARVKQGNAGGAITDLNTIRSRANLPPYAGATDQPSMLRAILHERQVELFTEWGNRWLDLIRTNSADSVMNIVTPLKNGTWSGDGHQELFPIPQNERGADPNLTQNPGY
jgi:starch-binding outer membrane protein, SusD/RagB family